MGRFSRRASAWSGVALGAVLALNCGGKEEGENQGGAGTGGTATAEGGAGGAAGSDDAGGEAGVPIAAGQAGQAGAAGETGAGGSPPIVRTSHKLDLLFVVDNSISMGDKQTLFAASLPALVERLIHPWCVGESGPAVPRTAEGSCPPDTEQEHPGLSDLHVGVITSSLGSQGGQVCSAEGDDDRAHLLGNVRPGLASWNDSGFLKWDPEASATPPGQDDLSLFAADLAEMVVAAGDTGCGYEAPLEAVYRFLVDPEPPLSVAQVDGVTVPSGLDEDLLAQRGAFLRPDSAVMVVVVSDENDCSIIDRGQGWLVGRQTNGGAAFNMPRATSVCAADPNDPCCRSCAAAGSPPEGCTPAAEDEECTKGAYTPAEDPLNLRCFDQKRRFGFDLLQPLTRYVDGLSKTIIQNRAGTPVVNPLFAGGRDPSLVMMTVIAGVPWQDLAVDPDAETLDYLSTQALSAAKRWPAIVGSFDAYLPPADPFMIESVTPRSGQNPITGDPIVDPSSTDPTATINGHETNFSAADDLQYACIFELPTPIDCSGGGGCDCSPDLTGNNSPLCQPPSGGAAGTTQYYGKAYPGIRQLELARRLESQSVVASVCPKNAVTESDDDYGYYPALRALQERLAPKLTR